MTNLLYPAPERTDWEKDYGRYGKDGELVVNFISNLDITGGNSGSAVVNGKGRTDYYCFWRQLGAMSGDIALSRTPARCIGGYSPRFVYHW